MWRSRVGKLAPEPALGRQARARSPRGLLSLSLLPTMAVALLAAYDEGHRATAAQPGSEGLGGAISANAWAAEQPPAPLGEAVRALLAAAEPGDGRIMLGFCADDAASGVAALKAWVTSLGLPKGTLHGMDRDGVPLDMSTFGSVYIKWTRRSNQPLQAASVDPHPPVPPL